MSTNLLHYVPQIAIFLETAIKTNRDFLNGILRYVRVNEPWGIHLFESRRDELKYTPISRRNLNGIIGSTGNPEASQILQMSRIPTVVLDPCDRPEPSVPFSRVSQVKCDSVAVGEKAALYLLERGFSHFAYVGEMFHKHWSEQRRDTFKAVLGEHHYSCHIYERELSEKMDVVTEQKELIRWLKQLPKPVGIFTAMDVRGRQVIDACRRGGINVPHEVGVLGVDDDRLLCEACCPPLSSILMDVEETGYKAAELLDHLMKREQRGPVTLVYGPKAVVSRQSTDSLLCCDPLVSKALQFIWMNAGKVMGVGKIADYLDVSRRSLEIRFRETTGKTILQELVRVRLQRVCNLLLTTEMTISEINEMSGFNSTSYLGSVFKKTYGLTMTEFRESPGRAKQPDWKACDYKGE